MNVPLLVRAQLAAGVATAGAWGISLDGLLAAQLWGQHKQTCREMGGDYVRARDTTDPPDLDLPLARCVPADAGPWHWAATCSYPEQDFDRVDVRTWTGRTDARAMEQMTATLPKVISDRQGRYRARRMPLLVTVTSTISWSAVGDLQRIRELLEPVVSIGKKRATGEGHVLRWQVQPSNTDPVAAAHLHPDGTLGRPTPPGCLSLLGDITHGGLGTAGVRPPNMHPGRASTLYLPNSR